MEQSPCTLDGLLRQAADSSERDFAFFSSGARLSARDLDERSGSLAAVLAGEGLRPGDRVILFSATSPETLVLFGACWKLGLIPVPVDRFIAPQALERILAVSRPRLALCGPDLGLEHLTPVMEAHGAPRRDVLLAQLPPIPFRGGPQEPETTGLCLFTSGSTGTPKGVLFTQRALLNGARNVLSTTGLGPGDRGLCVLPLTHMNGLITTFVTPLLSGGSIVYLEGDFSPAAAAGLIARHRCTWFSATPTHYALFLAPPLEPGSFDLSSLRFCRSASAPLPPRVLHEFEEHYGVPIVETMGTTETAGQIFSNPMPPGVRKPGSVGLPSPRLQVRIVADGREVQAPGERGELQVQGDCLMTGYLGDPEATAAAFADGWFKTGDIVERDADDMYRIVGRLKDIAIYCGLNIPLRSIEDAVHESGLVGDVACVGEPHPLLGETVVLYALPGSAPVNEETVARLIDLAASFLPAPQALSDIRFVERFPRSGVGKVLKGRLGEETPLYRYRPELPREPAALLRAMLRLPEGADVTNAALGLTPGWDSLAHVSLLLAVESVLDRRLMAAEIGAIMTFQGLASLLERGELPAPSQGAQRQVVNEVLGVLRDAGYGASPVTYLMLGFETCARKGLYNPDLLLDALLEALPPEGNLVLNAFSWRFCEGKPFHHQKSPTEVGLLNDLFLRREGVLRSQQAIYSYAVYGPRAAELSRHEAGTCWGPGSLTRRLGEENVRVVTFGLPKLGNFLFRANPTVHALEEHFQVPYRYFKTFSGIADFGEGFQPYSTRMYVRSLEPEALNSWDRLTRRLLARPETVYDEAVPVMSYWNREMWAEGLGLLEEDRLALLREDAPWRGTGRAAPAGGCKCR